MPCLLDLWRNRGGVGEREQQAAVSLVHLDEAGGRGFERGGGIADRDHIVDAVRGSDYPVTDRSVDVQIVGLRKKLGDGGKYIQTVRGVGYRFKE